MFSYVFLSHKVQLRHFCLASSESSVLKRFFHWNLFTNNSWINTSTRTTKAWILLNSSKSCVSTKNDSNFHYFASGGVKRLLYCMYFNSSDLFTRCCAWSLALCAFSICVCTGSRWIWRKIATLSFQCLIFSYSNIHRPYILRRSVPEVVAASVFLPARIFAEVVDALSRSTPSAKPQDHLFKEKTAWSPLYIIIHPYKNPYKSIYYHHIQIISNNLTMVL